MDESNRGLLKTASTLIGVPMSVFIYRLISSLCVLALCITPKLYGQTTGSLSGTVFDKSGSSIAGATVTITSQGTGVARLANTDDAGHYMIPLVAYIGAKHTESMRGSLFCRPSHRQNYAELCIAAHHSRVSLGRLFKRICFDHWAHTG
jgi:Carboxypeptidase regulatory-like domain